MNRGTKKLSIIYWMAHAENRGIFSTLRSQNKGVRRARILSLLHYSRPQAPALDFLLHALWVLRRNYTKLDTSHTCVQIRQRLVSRLSVRSLRLSKKNSSKNMATFEPTQRKVRMPKRLTKPFVRHMHRS